MVVICDGDYNLDINLYCFELLTYQELMDFRVVDIIAKLRLQKSGVMRRMTSIVQPILEKGIVDHTITHKLLIVYLTIADKDKSQSSSQTKDSDSNESGEEAKDEQEEIDLEENVAVAGGKKDSLLRRQELLVTSGLAEVCAMW
ncbi:unnamed protein product [Arabis nemorensis]|uniref:Uncharacterized protein n=1 Tax=Arabis nemorensis TaxID=586526 RepID=A0A565BAI4_9BRAS|nr:unnamed protein product [Arabis nemorensis]